MRARCFQRVVHNHEQNCDGSKTADIGKTQFPKASPRLYHGSAAVSLLPLRRRREGRPVVTKPVPGCRRGEQEESDQADGDDADRDLLEPTHVADSIMQSQARHFLYRL